MGYNYPSENGTFVSSISLSKRFGALSAEMAAQIASASLEQIETWFDKAIDASKLDDVFGGTT